MEMWDEIKMKLASTLSSESFENWVAGTMLQHQESGQMWVQVPNEAAREWMETEYRPLVEQIVHDLSLPLQKVFFEVRTGLPPTLSMNGYSGGADGPLFSNPYTQLTPTFTLNTFVVGSCNQSPH